ncbi:UNVERIFIED_CONTAM: hypothetical protein PYX00_010701 [Menopon gallinae]|uniref:Uncharacterized protein n=1 Tax=Menopon gallinae TaxID=328185 RepID=A0AAW2HGL1_9NEOP
MATPDYEETEIRDLLQPNPPSGIIKQGNCLKPSNPSRNQLSVTILDLGQSSYSDNEDQKSFVSNISTSGMDLQAGSTNSDDRRGSNNSQREGFVGGKSFLTGEAGGTRRDE